MDKPENLEEYARITTWHIEQYAYLLNRLKSIQEGDHTLLDNSMVMFTSDLRDGNRHAPRNLPILLGGRGGGKIKSGQNLAFTKETPLCCMRLILNSDNLVTALLLCRTSWHKIDLVTVFIIFMRWSDWRK